MVHSCNIALIHRQTEHVEVKPAPKADVVPAPAASDIAAIIAEQFQKMKAEILASVHAEIHEAKAEILQGLRL